MICINNNGVKQLTIGKFYKIIKTNSGNHYGSNKTYSGVWATNDENIVKHYSGKRFLNISDWREKQLNILVDEGSR